MEMKKYKLGEICSIIPGFAFKSSDFGTGSNYAIKIKDILPYVVNVNGAEKVSFTPDDRYKVHYGDYVMAMTGATIGKVGKILSYESNLYINQRVCKFVPKEDICDKQYLFYVLNSKEFKQFVLNNIDSKAAQPNIGHPTLYKYCVNLPCLTSQRKIASMLSSLDRKIALNRAINRNLPLFGRSLEVVAIRRVA